VLYKWDGVDWICLAQDASEAVGSYERGNDPSGSAKGGKFIE
jgi:hypothetical protein